MAICTRLLFLISCCQLSLSAQTYRLGGQCSLNARIKISPGGYFEASTEELTGILSLKNNIPGGRIVARLDTLKTGIGLRDIHMREKTLHTAQYPEAVFEPRSVTGLANLVTGEVKPLTITGDLTLHGTKRLVVAEARATLQPDGSITVSARLKLDLSDFGVEPPRLAFVRVANEVIILVNFVLSEYS